MAKVEDETTEAKKPKVTQKQVNMFIRSVTYTKMGDKTCVGLAVLKNGFEVCESASCVYPEMYDHDVGASLCLARIKDKVWMLLGFELQCKLAAGEAVPTQEEDDEDEPQAA